MTELGLNLKRQLNKAVIAGIASFKIGLRFGHLVVRVSSSIIARIIHTDISLTAGLHQNLWSSVIGTVTGSVVDPYSFDLDPDPHSE